MSAHIDHVVINVGQNLDEAAAHYARLGFTLTPRGHHSLGSSNHLAVFDTDYLELLGVEPQNTGKFQYPFPTGLSGLVFKTQDSTQLWQQLSSNGIPLEGTQPRAFFRPVELEDKQVSEAHFRTVRIAPEEIPNGRVFFCHHLTPDLVWRPQWQQHANGVDGILEYVYVTPDPDASADVLDRAFGPGVIAPISDGVHYKAGKATVLYLRPESIVERYGISFDQLPEERERAVALTVRTRSLQQVRAALEAGGIEGIIEVNNRIVVPPGQAAHVILAFEEQ